MLGRQSLRVQSLENKPIRYMEPAIYRQKVRGNMNLRFREMMSLTSGERFNQELDILINYITPMESEDYHFKFKVLIIGDKGVGKTSLLDSIAQAFGKITFSQQSDQMNIKSVNFVDEETTFKINYWEIPSRIRTSDYTFRYCLGGTAVVYLFDVTKRQSFENIEKWVQSNQKAEVPIKVLVGNKVDLYSTAKNAVQKNQALVLAKKLNMEYFEACSIGDSSITPIFDYIFSSISNTIPNPPTPQSLVGKGILLGKKLLNSSKYHLALCDIATLYE